jgi:DNA-binding response OmpR family regulator
MSSDNGLNNPSSADTIISGTAKSFTPTGATNNKRILIVDDEEDIAWCFKIGLECAGFVVDIFNDPMKSLINYKAGIYDIILLDIRMPQMSGFELYDRIKEIDNKPNVCFITAFEEYYDEFKKRFPHSEKTDWFIRKPIGIDDLIRTVKSRLNYD